MKVSNLKPLMSAGGRENPPASDLSIRGTEGQDVAVEAKPDRRRLVWLGAAVAGLVVILAFAFLIRGWSATEHVLSRERLRIATVTEGPFVRDVSAQGTVVAAVSPTLFAVAPGNISYQVRAGDSVKAGQVLATLASPTLENEYQRERATLESLDTALRRQSIEIRRQNLRTKEEADLADVQIRAAERELQRAQWAWDKGAIAERDLRRAQDERESAKLAYEHARETAGLEQESLDLDLQAKRLERERQGYVVANLKRRIDELTVALAGRRHGREPRRGGEGERPGERAAPDGRRSVGLRGRVPGRRRLRARHQARHGGGDLARRPGTQGTRHRHLAGGALRPGDRPREVRGRAAGRAPPEPARLGAHRDRTARQGAEVRAQRGHRRPARAPYTSWTATAPS